MRCVDSLVVGFVPGILHLPKVVDDPRFCALQPSAQISDLWALRLKEGVETRHIRRERSRLDPSLFLGFRHVADRDASDVELRGITAYLPRAPFDQLQRPLHHFRVDAREDDAVCEFPG